jgi:hypothetical protein
LARKKRKALSATTAELMRRVRKPMAPPAKIERHLGKYDRARERQRLRRGNGWQAPPDSEGQPKDNESARCAVKDD